MARARQDRRIEQPGEPRQQQERPGQQNRFATMREGIAERTDQRILHRIDHPQPQQHRTERRQRKTIGGRVKIRRMQVDGQTGKSDRQRKRAI